MVHAAWRQQPLEYNWPLWSEVLELYLVVRGTLLQAQTPAGHLLLTPERADVENERLRRALARYESAEQIDDC